MTSEKLTSIRNWITSSVWKIICGVMALVCLFLLVSYFSQGATLAENSLKNAQRVIIPLQGESAWIGTKVKVDVGNRKTFVKEEVAIARPQPKPPAKKAIEPIMPKPISGEGQAANLTGTVPESIPNVPEANMAQNTAVIVNEEMPKMVSPESKTLTASKTEPPKASPNAPLTPLAQGTQDKALNAAPTTELNEKVGEQLLPRVAKDGTTPWKHFGKPFEDDKSKPIIAVIIRGLGLGRLTTENALNLDSNITLSFSPYAKNTNMWGGHARNIGREIMLDLPQESISYPADDPGPYALLNTLDAQSNKERLHWVMGRVPGYVGFLQNDNPAPQSADMISAFAELANRGIFLIEAPLEKTNSLVQKQEQMGLVTQAYTRKLDEVLSEEEIKRQLNLLVKDAKKHGTAIAVARPYPLTLDLLNKWTEELDALGVTLAPVSAVIKREL